MQKDITEKRLEECNDVFADIYNGLVFEGRRILDPKHLIPIPTEAFTRNEDGSIRQGNRDICKADQKHGRYRLVCCAENQTGVDNTMPQRLMGYDYASYEEQVRAIKEANRQSGRPAYAKQIHDDQKLAPVVTTVIYWGAKKWDHPLCLHDMLDFPQSIEDSLRPLVPDYPVNLIQMRYLTEESRKRLTSDFRLIAEYAACGNQPKRLKEWIEDQNVVIRHPEELLDTLSAISSDRNYSDIKELIRGKGEMEGLTMYSILEEIKNEEMKKGYEQGIEMGIEQGIEQGVRALIKVCRNLGASKTDTAANIKEQFSLSSEDTEARIDKYWN